MKPIEISKHAREQMLERGVSHEEVIETIMKGEKEPVRSGRHIYTRNFQFDEEWRGQRYAVKQVAPIVAEETDKMVVVTVFAFYF